MLVRHLLLVASLEPGQGVCCQLLLKQLLVGVYFDIGILPQLVVLFLLVIESHGFSCSTDYIDLFVLIIMLDSFHILYHLFLLFLLIE